MKQKNITDDNINTEMFNEYIKKKGDGKSHPLKIILGLYKGNGCKLLRIACFWLAQHSPVWVIPIVTANIINAATNRPNNGEKLIIINLLIATFFLIQNIFSTYSATKIYCKISRKIESNLRGTLIRKLQQLSIMFHKDIQSGKLQSKIMRDVENIEVLMDQALRTIFFIFLDIVIVMSITFSKSMTVFFFFTATIPVAILTIFFFRKPMKEKNQEYRREIELTQGAVAEMIELIPVTRAHGLQDVEIGRMNERLNNVAERGVRLDLINSIFGSISWVLFQGFQVFCLGFTGYLCFKSKITIGEVVLFQTYFTQMVNQVSSLINMYPQITKGFESVISIGEIIGESNIEHNNSIVPLENLKGMVEFKDVCFRYKENERLILNGFSLKVEPGESIAFVGGSGAGKSTILNLLIGFSTPSEGKILIDKINMVNLDLNEYRSQIAVVPQTTILFSGTIRDNITYGLSNITDEIVNKVIDEVGLGDLVEAMPEGIYTRLGEHGGNLSGGQRQRISIARALIRKPKIIIFDEATSALDSLSEQKVQQATANMMKKCTTFLVAHRLSTIKNANKIVVVEQGNIVEIGSYDQLMQNKGAFYNLKSLQE